MSRLSRRQFLRIAAATGAGAGIGVPLLSGISGSSSTGVVLTSRLRLPAPFQVPLSIPPVLSPTRSDATGDHYEMTQRRARVEILPGVNTPIWGYDGIFPGPTIHARRGRTVTVHHRNDLPVPVVVHLHGSRTPHGSDGYPTDLIVPPGWQRPPPTPMLPADPHANVVVGHRDYVYPMTQQAATLWYHDHRMGFTGASVWRGLAGFFLIHDDTEQALPLPGGDRDLPIMLTDRAFDADGTLRYPSLEPDLYDTPGVHDPYSSGVLGDVILVNGRPWPYAEVVGARHRLRILNASNARRYRLTLDPPPPGGGGLVQIGSDGGLLERPIAHDAIDIAEAERFDIVIDFGRYRPGQNVVLRNAFGGGGTANVMRFQVTRRVRDDSHIPANLATIEPVPLSGATTTRHFLFQNRGGAMGWQINGQPFEPTVVNAATRLGDTEVWTLIADFHHPIHLHLVQFQILSRGLNGPGPHDHGWKDVIDLRPAEEATIVTRFIGYPGRYVFHCHNLEHEDMAMMGNFTAS